MIFTNGSMLNCALHQMTNWCYCFWKGQRTLTCICIPCIHVYGKSNQNDHSYCILATTKTYICHQTNYEIKSLLHQNVTKSVHLFLRVRETLTTSHWPLFGIHWHSFFLRKLHFSMSPTRSSSPHSQLPLAALDNMQKT